MLNGVISRDVRVIMIYLLLLKSEKFEKIDREKLKFLFFVANFCQVS
jgi:hypothetical protein